MTNCRPAVELEALLPADDEVKPIEGANHDHPQPQNWLCSPWFALPLLVVAVLAVYANSLRCPFVFDDDHDIIHNPSIRHLWPLGDVLFVRFPGSMRMHSRPVVNLSFALDYAGSGLNAQSYHGTNLAIHLFASLVLFGVIRRALLLPKLRDRFGQASAPLALAVALLWALHPLQTESVTYITQRYESMMGLFYLLAIYGVIRSSDSAESSRWAAVAVAATLLSLGCKEVAVSLPVMILLFDRMLLAGSFAEIWRRRGGMYLALLGAWAAFALLQLQAGPRPWAGYVLHISWWEYARSQPAVILHYLGLVFWPHPLILDYGWPPARAVGQILPGALVVVGILAASGYALWKRSAWGLLGAWFLLILAPTSSVMPLADLAVEHRMYLPLAAVVTAVVLGGYVLGQALLRRGIFAARAAAAISVCLLVTTALSLGYLTYRRNQDYQTEIALWQDAVNNNSGNSRAHNNLGNSLARHGRFREAVAEYRKALKIWPDYVAAHNNLGVALAHRGEFDNAISQYRMALQIGPESADVYNNLGAAFTHRGRVVEAIAQYRKALRIEPDLAEVHYNLANLLADRGETKEAIEHYQTALALATCRNDRVLASAIEAQIRRRQELAPPAKTRQAASE